MLDRIRKKKYTSIYIFPIKFALTAILILPFKAIDTFQNTTTYKPKAHPLALSFNEMIRGQSTSFRALLNDKEPLPNAMEDHHDIQLDDDISDTEEMEDENPPNILLKIGKLS